MLASRDTRRIPLPHLSLGILVTGMLLAAIYGSLTEQGQLELWMQGTIPVIAAGIIFYAIKRGLPFVGSWSLYGIGLLVRAAGHILPAIPSLRFAPPAAILGGQLALFLIGSSILVAGIALYLYSHSQRWPRYRLYIDVLFILIFLVMMTFNVVYEKARYSPINPLIHAEAISITLVYFLTASLIVSLLGHLNFKEVRFSQILLSIGIGLLILSGILRMLAVYQLAFINSQIQNRLVTVSYFFFAISALYMNRHPDISENMILTSVQSLRRFFGFSVMIFIIALGFLMRLIGGLVFIRMAFVAVWYFLAQHMVSILAVNEGLLEEHRRYTDRLEDMVRERTRKVTEINNELEQAAFHDPLTGMRSRKFMLDQITSLLEKKLPFSLFLIDLVHFRYINDIHGNEMGDLILQALGEDSRRAKNSNLITARMGGR